VVVTRSIQAAVERYGFRVLTGIERHQAMLPEVREALRGAKALSRKMLGAAVVSEALTDEAEVELTFYPGTVASPRPCAVAR
jgi:hypothetical protein